MLETDTEMLSLSVVKLGSRATLRAVSDRINGDDSGNQKQQEPVERQAPRSSRWNKLRSTVQVANAASAVVTATRRNGVNAGRNNQQQHQLSREDSFLKKFSTRYGGAPYASSAAADRAADEADRLDNGDEACRRRLGGPQVDVEGEAGRDVDEARRRRRRKRRFVVNPDENFAFYWLAITSLAVMYNLWTCIARQAFPEIQQACNLCWITVDAIFDLVYALDIVIQARTGYLERGLVVYDGRKLCRHYFCSWHFAVDAFSLLPLDLVQLVVGVCPIIRAPRFLKSYQLLRFVHVFEMRTAYPNMWRVANLSHVLFLGSHWFAAFYYLISAAEDFQLPVDFGGRGLSTSR